MRYLLVNTDYTAVVGYADSEHALDPRGYPMPRIIGYDTNRQRLFSRKGLSSADRRAHELGMRLIAPGYFGLDNARPEHISAAAWAVAEAKRRGFPIPPANTEDANGDGASRAGAA